MKALRALLDEAKGDQFGPDAVVIGNLGGLVPDLEHHVGVQLGRPGPQPGRGGVASLHLVAEELL
jgi:hypothetical protein